MGGFAAAELRTAGFSVGDLVRGGFKLPELNQAGWSARELKRVYTKGYARPGPPDRDDKQETVRDYTVRDLKEMRSKGFVEFQARERPQLKLAQLFRVGFTAAELLPVFSV